MNNRLNRRRFIKIAAAHSLGFFLGSKSNGQTVPLLPTTQWNGIVLGADASMQLYHPNQAEAQQLIQACHQLILELESHFSLYDEQSTLSQLNQKGYIENPPTVFTDLLTKAIHFSHVTEGAFDVSMHPLIEHYRHFFSQKPSMNESPSAASIDAVLKKIGYRSIACDEKRVALQKPNMKLTLNGIAQGYITDKVSELLKAHNIKHVLVEVGEKRALGTHPSGRPFQIGIAHTDNKTHPSTTVSLANKAMATSGGYGTPFDASGKFHHLIDPRTGTPSNRYQSVTVLAPEAADADALSTALSLVDLNQAQSLLSTVPQAEAVFVFNDGQTKRL